MVYVPFSVSSSLHAVWCFVVMLARCIGEVAASVALAPCRRSRGRHIEVPEVVHVDTPFHR